MLQAQREAFGLSYMHHSKLQNGGCALLSWPKSHTHIPGSQPYCSAFRIHKRTTSSLRPRRISQYSPPQALASCLQMSVRTYPTSSTAASNRGVSAFRKKHVLYAQGYTVSPQNAHRHTHIPAHDSASLFFLKESLFLEYMLSAPATPGRREKIPARAESV